jgi:methionine sulfoxide reductase heme-binding subunit
MKQNIPLRIAVHIFGLFPLLWLLGAWLTNNLTVNPIQFLLQQLGLAALYQLAASLACTPLNTAFGWREMLRHRRTLGLYAFFYASAHVLVFAVLDYGLNFGLIWRDLTEKPFIVLGTLAFLILLPMAVTSFNIWKKRLKQNWKRLHRLVYLAALLVIIHFAWARKGNIFTLSGDVLQPLLLGILIFALLMARVPSVQNALAEWRASRPK